MRSKTRFFYITYLYSAAYLLLSFLGLVWFKNIPSAMIFLVSVVLSGSAYWSMYMVCIEPSRPIKVKENE